MQSLPLVQARIANSRPAKADGLMPIRRERQVLSGDGNNSARWREGERLNHVFEECCARFGNADAVITEDDVFTYDELNGRANQVARHLVEQGLKSGDRVGLLFDKTIETYVAMLAVLKVNAAYVPFDPAFPVERLRFIVTDANLKAVVSMSAFDERLRALDVRQIYLDSAARRIDAMPRTRLTEDEVAPPVDQACYIIYTSGTTGNPKGVVIEHPSICNFVRVAAELYGFAPGDRVYQGMTIAFDFSVEEIWVPLVAGATLVPGRSGVVLVADELADFLERRKVTCICCCPTLLATIERDLPQIRILLVGGEACPRNLVVRWHRPGRTILNSYGPTEATVTATLTELTPTKPVTIGRPLPTYSIVILDPEADQTVARGERGEIGIAGIGLAAGYLNRDELTDQKFIRDFLQLPNNPSNRIYRTGDVGRINDEGEVEYHGRIDTQIKIRGHRIELAEIETVLLDLPQISQAAVATFEPEPGLVELVGYYSLKQGQPGLSRGDILKTLRSRLPACMVPAFLEELPFIPMLISNKTDRKQLPRPKGSRVQSERAIVAPTTDDERFLARALAEILKVEEISVDDHFFNDLGANSLLMARFCAKVRQNRTISAPSMQDIYLNPTIAKLAERLALSANDNIASTAQEPFHVPSNLAYYGCGTLQLLFYAGYGLLSLWLLDAGFSWTYAASDSLDLYLRSAGFGVSAFAVFTAIPVAAKWLLIGRWKEEKFPIWSLRYFRFWVVQTLIRTAPPAAFVGSAIYNAYLRLLGAKIG
ncbi:MAG: hypothetical protein QOJ59_5363, partial [Thermomicrobiales bacterium]|nr:hypothetical protein [Thermomicrobiales bacterium]